MTEQSLDALQKIRKLQRERKANEVLNDGLLFFLYKVMQENVRKEERIWRSNY